MSQLDDWADKAMAEVKEHGVEWIDKGLEEWRDMIPGDAPTLTRDLSEAGLTIVERHKVELARMGEAGLAAFLGWAAIGNYEKASLVYLRTQAGWGQLHGALDQAGQKILDKVAEKEAAVKLAKEIGSSAAKAVLPLVLAAGGL